MLKDKIMNTLSVLRAFLPSKLPITLADHDTWAISILKTAKLPDNDSFRHALATMVMHLGPTTVWKAKMFFILSLQKAIANEIAYNVMQDLKKAQSGQQVQDTTATVVQKAQDQGL